MIVDHLSRRMIRELKERDCVCMARNIKPIVRQSRMLISQAMVERTWINKQHKQAGEPGADVELLVAEKNASYLQTH